MKYTFHSSFLRQTFEPVDTDNPMAWLQERLSEEDVATFTWWEYLQVVQPATPPNPSLIMEGRRNKGAEVVKMFGDDNYAAGITLSASQTKALNEDFRALREMLEGGFLSAALVYIRALPTDSILTADRKLKYRTLLEDHLAQEMQ